MEKKYCYTLWILVNVRTTAKRMKGQKVEILEDIYLNVDDAAMAIEEFKKKLKVETGKIQYALNETDGTFEHIVAECIPSKQDDGDYGYSQEFFAFVDEIAYDPNYDDVQFEIVQYELK